MTAPNGAKAVQRLSEWPGRYPVVTFVALVLVAVLGAVRVIRIPIHRLVHVPVVPLRVHADLPGLDAATVETTVTVPLERALTALPGHYDVESRSRYGGADILFRFADLGDHRKVLAQAQTLLTQGDLSLPAGMAKPTVAFDHTARPPAAIYAVAAKALSNDLVRWVRNVLVDPLREIPEVASVAIDGQTRHVIRIQPESRRLAALGLSFDDLIDALRRSDLAPRRRKSAQRQVVTPGSAESIAARAVRLPNGEPIALAEVARVSRAKEPAAVPLRVRGVPGLRVKVYARPGADAVHVAERANAHVAWLRANGLVPGDAHIYTLHDESRALARWLRRILERAGICLAVILGVIAIGFGVRLLKSAALAFAVWLPVSLGALAITEYALNVSTAAGLMLAAVPFGVMLVSRFTTSSLWRIAIVGAIAWIFGLLFAADAQASAAFALGLSIAAFVRWLMTPWLLRGETADSPGDTVTPASWHRLRPPPTATVAAILMLITVGTLVYALRAVDANDRGGTFVFRLSGNDPQRLAAIVDPMAVSLHVIPAVGEIVSSTERKDSWRLKLDREHMQRLGIGLAEVGRAFAIARDGLVVDEIVNADEQLPLRMQLAPGAAGGSYAQLLLRGETTGHPAVYLRDVGVAEKADMLMERDRINREPAVEITAHWRNAGAREALADFCDRVDLPKGYRLDCIIRDSPI